LETSNSRVSIYYIHQLLFIFSWSVKALALTFFLYNRWYLNRIDGS
jgi:hypothetical protein